MFQQRMQSDYEAVDVVSIKTISSITVLQYIERTDVLTYEQLTVNDRVR